MFLFHTVMNTDTEFLMDEETHFLCCLYVSCSESNTSYSFPWNVELIQRGQQLYLIEHIFSCKKIVFLHSHHH